MDLAEYTWMSLAPAPPGRWDLRHLGWHLHPVCRAGNPKRGVPLLLDWRVDSRCTDWGDLRHKQSAIAVGVD